MSDVTLRVAPPLHDVDQLACKISFRRSVKYNPFAFAAAPALFDVGDYRLRCARRNMVRAMVLRETQWQREGFRLALCELHLDQRYVGAPWFIGQRNDIRNPGGPDLIGFVFQPVTLAQVIWKNTLQAFAIVALDKSVPESVSSISGVSCGVAVLIPGVSSENQSNMCGASVSIYG